MIRSKDTSRFRIPIFDEILNMFRKFTWIFFGFVAFNLCLHFSVNVSFADWGPNETVKILAGDGEADDRFGNSVSISGDTAIIAAYLDDDNGYNSGSVYIFNRTGNTWNEQAKLTPSDGEAVDSFGVSVSISGDTAIVGAFLDDDNGNLSGSAYIFSRTGNTWSEQAKLKASDGAPVDHFGRSVSISNDTAIVGAFHDDDNGTDSGSAYVFIRNGNTWSELAKLTASDGEADDEFGISVSISGNTAIVGAINGINSGSAYIFTRTGDTWSEQAILTPSDGAAYDLFGRSVSVSGNTAIAGAFRDDDNGDSSGSAYVFSRSGNTWIEQAKLTPSDGEAVDRFGFSVSISGDTAIVGADLAENNSASTGTAYIFTNTGNTWSELAKLIPSDGEADDQFGNSVSISGDTAFVGAVMDNDNGNYSGSAYIFMNQPAGAQAIPTLNQWGGIVMALLFAGASLWMIKKRQIQSSSSFI